MAWNWLNAASGGAKGGLGGAASGALLGSFIAPGIGTGIGAGIGGLLGLLAGGASEGTGQTGAGSGYEQTPNKFSPEQQKALNQSLSTGMQNLQNPTAGFEPIAQDARRQFNTQTVPGLAERFTAFGGGQGGQRSSAFQGALGSAGANLESQLAALRADYGLRNQSNALQQLQFGSTPQQDWQYFGQRPDLGGSLLQAGGGALGQYLGGGGDFGSLFGRGGGQQSGGQGNLVLTPDLQQKLMRLLQMKGVL